MADIRILHRLPFVTVNVHANGKMITLERVLLDTGSAGTAFRTDDMETLGIRLADEDRIRYMIGVGGREAVIEKQVEAVEIGGIRVSPFTIQVGALNYGFELQGFVGTDFLLAAGAQINFKTLTLT